MAALPPNLKDTNRRSSSSHHRANMSHGRGGAGNIGNADSDHDPITLETPTIKTQVYTTGRGGSGNMAKNDNPEEARRAQDVVGYACSICYKASPLHITYTHTYSTRIIYFYIARYRAAQHANNNNTRHPRRESTSSTHVGRGGAANIFKPSAEEMAKAKSGNGSAKWEGESAVDDEKEERDGKAQAPKGLADRGKEWLMGKKK
ncbi:hypothetical protein LCER1_G009316 [Lachnellula cervina]|uniref:Uncharacterized protein n=1 Tax=Lachnellula cervina TaxID=1316786 RepID=A0A7D8YMZ7_9HELO|nr:hypothetical protein LCER1_G009316 [Lachnellula cervina]